MRCYIASKSLFVPQLRVLTRKSADGRSVSPSTLAFALPQSFALLCRCFRRISGKHVQKVI